MKIKVPEFFERGVQHVKFQFEHWTVKMPEAKCEQTYMFIF